VIPAGIGLSNYNGNCPGSPIPATVDPFNDLTRRAILSAERDMKYPG
jgi:hypothetical protein